MKKKVDNDKWRDILSAASPQMSAVSFRTWIKPLTPLETDDEAGTITIAASDQFVLNLVRKNYIPVLEKSVDQVYGRPLRVILKHMGKDDISEALSSPQNETQKKLKPASLDSFQQEYFLNPRYNFDNFIVGANNNYAHAVSLAVAETPAGVYNPLFIYGGSGLGKTHLMHAIGNHILKNDPEKKVLYVSSEMFTSEVVEAKRSARDSNAQINALKKKYRTIDVLLIDDIQFIEGKEATQNEFFHTFNTLYEFDKQIVITSDRHPSKLTDLDERLRTRFQWNIVADIQPPDFETRVAILRNKAEQEGAVLDDDMLKVIDLIAEKVKFNVRELESALTRIISFSKLFNQKLTVQLAKEKLTDIFDPRDVTINCETIKQTVCRKYSIRLSDMESSKRKREFTYPRQIAMYLCREMTDLSLPKIGESFGGRDHTTVLHAYDKISSEMKTNSLLAEEIRALKEDLQ